MSRRPAMLYVTLLFFRASQATALIISFRVDRSRVKKSQSLLLHLCVKRPFWVAAILNLNIASMESQSLGDYSTTYIGYRH